MRAVHCLALDWSYMWMWMHLAQFNWIDLNLLGVVLILIAVTINVVQVHKYNKKKNPYAMHYVNYDKTYFISLNPL